MLLRESKRGPVLCFDLENRPLAYWYDGETTAQITAFGWKWHDETAVCSMLLRRDGRFDTSWGSRLSAGRAYDHFRGQLERAALVYGHNIRRHDLGLLNAGMLRLNMPPLRRLLTTDTLRDFVSRKGMAASLDALADQYQLGGAKLHMSQPAWERANQLNPSGVSDARERVESDVLLQEKLRDRLLELGYLKPPKWWTP